MSLLERTQPTLLFIQLFLHLIEFDPKELSSSGRLSFTQLEVLFDKPGSQGVGHFHHGFRVPASETEGEGDGRAALALWFHCLGLHANIAPLELHANIATHPINDLFRGHPFAKFRIQVESEDQLLEPRPAQDLLADCLHSRLRFARDGRLDECL